MDKEKSIWYEFKLMDAFIDFALKESIYVDDIEFRPKKESSDQVSWSWKTSKGIVTSVFNKVTHTCRTYYGGSV